MNGKAELGSWTRTLNEEDAVLLLEQTEPGMSREDWEEQGHRALPQSSRPRRRETLRIVGGSLVDWQDDRVIETAFLRLYRLATARRRSTLLYGRLLGAQPWILRAIAELVLPQLEATHEPLAPPDADLITDAQWRDFIRAHADIPDSAFAKTRSTIHKNLANLGVLRVEGASRRTTRARHAEPDPIAFGWLLAHELTTSGRSEASQSWARVDALATKLFAARPEYADRCIDVAAKEGLLRRGFLAGMSRLHVGEAYS